jgi:hypothetical protein
VLQDPDIERGNPFPVAYRDNDKPSSILGLLERTEMHYRAAVTLMVGLLTSGVELKIH